MPACRRAEVRPRPDGPPPLPLAVPLMDIDGPEFDVDWALAFAKACWKADIVPRCWRRTGCDVREGRKSSSEALGGARADELVVSRRQAPSVCDTLRSDQDLKSCS